jgi:hypothetical protein
MWSMLTGHLELRTARAHHRWLGGVDQRANVQLVVLITDEQYNSLFAPGSRIQQHAAQQNATATPTILSFPRQF